MRLLSLSSLTVLTNVLGAGIEMQCSWSTLVVFGAPLLGVSDKVRAELVCAVLGRRATLGRVAEAEARRATELVVKVQVEEARLASGNIRYYFLLITKVL